MDANRAQAVRERIAAHEHWSQAEAVRDRRQPASDPDADQLVEIRDGYLPERVAETLVAGRWETALEGTACADRKAIR